MNRWLWRAMLRESASAARDNRSLHAILVLAALAALLIAGTHLEPHPLDEVLRRELEAIAVARPGLPPQVWHAIEVRDVEVSAEDACAVTIGIPNPALARTLLEELRWAAAARRGEAPPSALRPLPSRAPLAPAELDELVERVCGPRGFGPATIEPGPQPGHHTLRLAPPHPGEVAGGGVLTAGFGLVTMELAGTRRSYHELLLYAQLVAVNWLGGAFALVLAIALTAGSFPSLLAPGSAEHVLARPHPRWSIFLARWTSDLAAFAAFPAVLIGGAFLAVGLRAGLWNTGVLLAVPLVVAQFAVLSALASAAGVYTRSMPAALLATFLGWALCFAASLARSSLIALRLTGLDQLPGLGAPSWLRSGVELAYQVLPSFTDFDYAAAWCVAQAPVSEALRTRLLEQTGFALQSEEVPGALLRSLGFGALCLACALRGFCRRAV